MLRYHMLFRRMNINIKYISILYTDSCMLYYCNECLICTSSRADYNKHLQTNKHLKKQGNASVGITNNMTQIEVNANANINLNASNNPINHDSDHDSKKIFNKDKRCKYCDVCYSYLSGLSRHMKTCKGMIPEQSQITSSTDANVTNIMNTIIQENVVFKQMIVDVVKNNQETTNKLLVEISKNNANNVQSVTNNIYNHKGDNNHFSINLFLNEKCKDAMNMTDFVKAIELTTEDMEMVGRNGYVRGISTIFIDNLKNTDIHKRPIHCTDRKREILYVREDDKWEREDINSTNMINAVRTVEQKNINLINEWAKQHPECEKSYTRANELYMKLSKHACDGEDDNIKKVVRNIAKETVIERNILVE